MVAATGTNQKHDLHRKPGSQDPVSVTATGRSAPKQPLRRKPGFGSAENIGAPQVHRDRFNPNHEYIDWNDSHLSGKHRNAASALISVLSAYGLSDLAPEVVKYVKKGYDQSTIYLELQQTKAWQKRFAGNVELQKKGLAPLSPADYLSTEAAYGQVMRQYGLPKGFMDSHTDFATLIGKGVSPSELQDRAQAYTSFAATKDASTVKALSEYGLGVGDLAAYYMNPGRALPLLQKRTAQVQVAASALRQGLSGVSKSVVGRLVANGVTGEQAQQAFGNVAQYGHQLGELGDIYGENYTQNTAINDFALGQGGAAAKREKLASRERATWGGSSHGEVGSGSSSQAF